jgi:excisionase family DNA binding protein
MDSMNAQNLSNPLDPLADANADRIRARIQARLAEPEQVSLLSVPAAAKRLGISKTKLYGMIASGEMPAKLMRRIGRRTQAFFQKIAVAEPRRPTPEAIGPTLGTRTGVLLSGRTILGPR